MKYFQLNKWWLLGKKHMNFVPFGFPEKITLSESYWILVRTHNIDQAVSLDWHASVP